MLPTREDERDHDPRVRRVGVWSEKPGDARRSVEQDRLFGEYDPALSGIAVKKRVANDAAGGELWRAIRGDEGAACLRIDRDLPAVRRTTCCGQSKVRDPSLAREPPPHFDA